MIDDARPDAPISSEIHWRLASAAAPPPSDDRPTILIRLWKQGTRFPFLVFLLVGVSGLCLPVALRLGYDGQRIASAGCIILLPDNNATHGTRLKTPPNNPPKDRQEQIQTMAQQRRPATAALIGASVLLALASVADAFMAQQLQQALLRQGKQHQCSSRTGVRTLVARAPEFGRKAVRSGAMKRCVQRMLGSELAGRLALSVWECCRRAEGMACCSD